MIKVSSKRARQNPAGKGLVFLFTNPTPIFLTCLDFKI
jgi:hypothetical protein